jgi:hypothetical protein
VGLVTFKCSMFKFTSFPYPRPPRTDQASCCPPIEQTLEACSSLNYYDGDDVIEDDKENDDCLMLEPGDNDHDSDCVSRYEDLKFNNTSKIPAVNEMKNSQLVSNQALLKYSSQAGHASFRVSGLRRAPFQPPMKTLRKT